MYIFLPLRNFNIHADRGNNLVVSVNDGHQNRDKVPPLIGIRVHHQCLTRIENRVKFRWRVGIDFAGICRSSFCFRFVALRFSIEIKKHIILLLPEQVNVADIIHAGAETDKKTFQLNITGFQNIRGIRLKLGKIIRIYHRSDNFDLFLDFLDFIFLGNIGEEPRGHQPCKQNK